MIVDLRTTDLESQGAKVSEKRTLRPKRVSLAKAGSSARDATNLSRISSAFIGLTFLVVLLLVSQEHGIQNLVTLILIAINPAVLLYTYKRLCSFNHKTVNILIRAFAAGFVPGAIFAAAYDQVAQLFLVWCLGYPSTDDALTSTSFAGGKRSLASSLAFLVVLSYGTTATIEELCKLGASQSISLPAVWSLRDTKDLKPPNLDIIQNTRQARLRAMTAVGLAISSASGFAASENILYLMGSSLLRIWQNIAQTPNHNAIHNFHEGLDSFSYWNVALFRILIVTSLHVICGILTGTNVALHYCREQKYKKGTYSGTMLWVALPAILLHGSYDLVINMMHADELRSNACHNRVLWLIGVMSLAVGMCATRSARNTLQNELRAATISFHKEMTTKLETKPLQSRKGDYLLDV